MSRIKWLLSRLRKMLWVRVSLFAVFGVAVAGLASLSNRLYSVVERSNHQVKSVSETMVALYPDVDFTELRDVRAMLLHLRDQSPTAFKVVEIEIRRAWVARMREMLDAIEAPKLLLWVGDRAPATELTLDEAGFGPEMVTQAMIEDLQGHTVEFVCHVSDTSTPDPVDLAFGESASGQSEDMHSDIAEQLYPHIRGFLRSNATHRQVYRKTLKLFGFGD